MRNGQYKLKKVPLRKNPQFLSKFDETLPKWPKLELVKLAKFHQISTKNEDFSLIVFTFWGLYCPFCISLYVCSFLKGLLSLISGQRCTLKLNVRICIKSPSYTWPVLRKWEAALCLLDIGRSGRQVKLKLLGIFWQIMTLGDSSLKIRSYFPIYPHLSPLPPLTFFLNICYFIVSWPN